MDLWTINEFLDWDDLFVSENHVEVHDSIVLKRIALAQQLSSSFTDSMVGLSSAFSKFF